MSLNIIGIEQARSKIIPITAKSAAKNSTSCPYEKTPGKYVEVYVVMGSLPKRYYDDKPDSKGYMRQFQIVAFYSK